MCFRVINIIDGKWGALVDKETSSFNGMIGMVQRKVKTMTIHDMNESISFHVKEAHLAMGDITRTVIRETAVDFSFPYFITRVGYFTKKPYPLPRILSIVWPFKEFLWLCLVVTLPIFSLIYWLIAKFQPGHQNLGLQDLVTHVMMIFLYQSKL